MPRPKFEHQRQALIKQLPTSDVYKSSHWQHYTSGRRLSVDGTISGISGFGGSSKYSPPRQAVHDVLQRYIHWVRHPVFRSESYRRGRQVTRAQDRTFDIDMLSRHAFTIELLMKHLPAGNEICVIGDGQANFVSAALFSGWFSRIISINLTDVLLHDLSLLERLDDLNSDDIAVVQTTAEFNVARNSEPKVVLIAAHHAQVLRSNVVLAFVSIASFQEMPPEIVHGYFDIIASNASWLYCCNRELKILRRENA